MLHATELYGQWLRRDLSQRYAGSVLGPLWLLLQPLSFLAVITLVFNGFFRTKWPGSSGSALDYGLQVFVGLAVHNLLAEVLGRAPGAISAHAYLVTKVRFPLLLLPLVTVGVATAQWMLSLGLMLVALAFLGPLSLAQMASAWWAIPLVALPALLLAGGLAVLLAALGVYLRDLGNLMPALSGFLMFLMPVFYPAEFVPPALSWFIDYNPLAFTIEALRSLLFRGEGPSFLTWLLHLSGSAALCALGVWVFQRVRPGFADVL